jgi:hypothetical protein
MSERDVAMRMLCRCAAVAPGDSELRAAAANVADWGAAIDLAVGHGVAALAATALSRARVSLPAGAATRLAEQRRAHRRRGVAAAAETVRLLRVLGDAGIPALPLKGPVLAVQAYGDTGARDYGDVDLLVGHRDLARARAALERDGYAPTRTWTAREERWYLRTLDQVVRLARPGSALPVEVHGRVHPPFFQLRMEGGMWRRRTELALEGPVVAAMSLEDTLLVACTHGSREEWRRLESVAAVGHLAARADLDWALAMHAAAEAGAVRMLGVGLRLARDVLGQSLPPEAERAACGATVARLAGGVERGLLTGDPLSGDRQGFNRSRRVLHLQIRERRRDRARYAVRLLLAPTLTEVNMFRLPRPLEPLYSLVRVVRLVLRAPRRLLGAA